jgi:hypothetical protein
MAPREQPFSTSSTALSFLVVIGLLLVGFLPIVSKLPGLGTIGTPLRENFGQQPPETAALGGKDNWTEAEIAHGREECMHLLQSVAANVEVLAPIKSGDCGLPAPVRMKSVGSSSTVVFDPPVEVNCRMMAALYRWNKTTLQPAARNTLGSPVVRILGASGYACRNVYNLPGGNLSQHAFANAIDIAALELQDGRSLTVLKGWGPTVRDLTAQAKAKSERPQAHMTAKSPLFVSGRDLTKASLSLKTPTEQKQELSADRTISPELGIGALKPTTATNFLRTIHDGACGEFETVLGPEANEEHRSHFHLDLNPLRIHAHCE